jgi:hypothetical protein
MPPSVAQASLAGDLGLAIDNAATHRSINAIFISMLHKNNVLTATHSDFKINVFMS